jgi:acyl carrier protein phosphodiesterase
MNYLGHAFLSFGQSELLLGNMIGDHVKGKAALEHFPEGIRKGIMLHRKIDEFADHHPATARAKTIFRADYGLYSGAIMDTLYDHFLANDAKYFQGPEQLKDFAATVYVQLEEHAQWFPEKIHDLLFLYENTKLAVWISYSTRHGTVFKRSAQEGYEYAGDRQSIPRLCDKLLPAESVLLRAHR